MIGVRPAPGRRRRGCLVIAVEDERARQEPAQRRRRGALAGDRLARRSAGRGRRVIQSRFAGEAVAADQAGLAEPVAAQFADQVRGGIPAVDHDRIQHFAQQAGQGRQIGRCGGQLVGQPPDQPRFAAMAPQQFARPLTVALVFLVQAPQQFVRAARGLAARRQGGGLFLQARRRHFEVRFLAFETGQFSQHLLPSLARGIDLGRDRGQLRLGFTALLQDRLALLRQRSAAFAPVLLLDLQLAQAAALGRVVLDHLEVARGRIVERRAVARQTILLDLQFLFTFGQQPGRALQFVAYLREARVETLDLALQLAVARFRLGDARFARFDAPSLLVDAVLEHQHLTLGLLQILFEGVQGLFQLTAFGLAFVDGRLRHFDARLQFGQFAHARLGQRAEFLQAVARLGLARVQLLASAPGHQQIQPADLAVKALVPARLADLPLQRADLLADLLDDVIETHQIALGAVQLALRLLAPGLVLGDA